jgi:hypothetical protein
VATRQEQSEGKEMEESERMRRVQGRVFPEGILFALSKRNATSFTCAQRAQQFDSLGCCYAVTMEKQEALNRARF